jgi:hypothetical protein
MDDRDLQALYLSAEQRWMRGWVDGPTLEANPLRRGSEAPDVEVLDEGGEPIGLATLWRDSPGLVRPLVDDPWMQSGEFVVAPDGNIRVAYLYNYCADYPDPRVLTTAARLVSSP